MSSFDNWTTNPQKVLPSAAAGVSVTPNATAFTNSDYTEITAGLTVPIAVVGLLVNNNAIAADYRVDIATGAAMSEVVKGTLTNRIESDTGMGFLEFKMPFRVEAGTRIAVRMRKSGTSVTAWFFKLIYYEMPVMVPALRQNVIQFRDSRALLSRGRMAFSGPPRFAESRPPWFSWVTARNLHGNPRLTERRVQTDTSTSPVTPPVSAGEHPIFLMAL